MGRRFALSTVLWVYGIAVTVTLVSVWGRAVVVDASLMADAAADSATAGPVATLVEQWLARELSELGGGSPVIEGGSDDPVVAAVFAELAREIVLASAVRPGEEAVVDVAEILEPAVPAVADNLAANGVDEAAVSAYFASLDPLVVRRPDSRPPVGPSSGAARSLYLATVVGLLTMAASGGAALWMAGDRRAMAKSLLSRLGLGALGFAVMFRLGAWILDPGAGRSPFRLAASRIVGAKLWIPMMVAAFAGAGVWGLWAHRHHRVTPGEGSPSPGG